MNIWFLIYIIGTQGPQPMRLLRYCSDQGYYEVPIRPSFKMSEPLAGLFIFIKENLIKKFWLSIYIR